MLDSHDGSNVQTMQAFYTEPGAMSVPGQYAACFDDIPNDIPGLVRAVQGLMIHVFWASRYGLELSDERKSEVQIRPLHRKMARLLELDPRPLSQPRPMEQKLVGNSRDFSLVTSAILRSKGIPARARCGFGTYFMPNHYEDHWVVEYWKADEARWGMLDAQLDEFQQNVLGIPFNTLDMPAGAFVTGGAAWQLCRQGQANPDDFGIFEWRGWDFVKGNLFRDLLSLNKVEVLPWDDWSALEPAYAQASPEQIALFDRVAELTQPGILAFDELREFYETHPTFHAPMDWAD